MTVHKIRDGRFIQGLFSTSFIHSFILPFIHSFDKHPSSILLCISSQLHCITIMAPSARGWQMIEIVTVLVALCFITTVLRVVARLRRRVGFGVDDYLSILSMVLLIAMLIELGLCEFVESDNPSSC